MLRRRSSARKGRSVLSRHRVIECMLALHSHTHLPQPRCTHTHDRFHGKSAKCVLRADDPDIMKIWMEKIKLLCSDTPVAGTVKLQIYFFIFIFIFILFYFILFYCILF